MSVLFLRLKDKTRTLHFFVLWMSRQDINNDSLEFCAILVCWKCGVVGGSSVARVTQYQLLDHRLASPYTQDLICNKL